MAKSQNKSGRETRKAKSGQASGQTSGQAGGKKVPRYLRDGAQAPVEIPAFKPAKKAPPAN